MEKEIIKLIQRNNALLRSVKNLHKRIEFIESMTLRLPEFKKVYGYLDKMTEKDNDLVKLQKIVEYICKYYKIKSEIILTGKSRKRELSEIKQICHYFVRNYTNLSLSAIGSHIGSNNHATVLYSCSAIKDKMFYDKTLKKQIEEIRYVFDNQIKDSKANEELCEISY